MIGTGRMGQCMASLLKGLCDLTVVSRDASRVRRMPGGLKAMGMASTDLYTMDIVIMAVPTAALLASAKQISCRMRPGSLIVDISSVKCGVVERLCKALPDSVDYISIHPLFASAGVKVKNTIVVPVRPGKWSSSLALLLSSAGMSLKEASAEEHDRAMATVQAVHHFALMALKNVMARRGLTGQALDPFLTHNMLRTMHTIRMVDSNSATIEMIQKTNKHSSQARKEFIEEAIKLDKHYAA